ncbi:hypothetical protein LDL59_11035 [Kaistella anthropi]|nr:hypothetical protein [Kaistella anthropi]
MGKNYDNEKELTTVITHRTNSDPVIAKRLLKTDESETFIRFSEAISIIEKTNQEENLSKFISPLRPFGFRGYFTKDEKFRSTKRGLDDAIICFGKGKKLVTSKEMKFW